MKQNQKQDEPMVFVGMRVRELPVPHVPSSKGKCQACQEAIWISRGSMTAAMAAERTLCVECMLLELPPEDGRYH